MLLCGTVPARAQQTDPTLTAAVILQTEELKSIQKKRKSTQEKIIAAETAVTLALDRVHNVENRMLEYLSNAQGAMQNLYQIKRAAELVATEIPRNHNAQEHRKCLNFASSTPPRATACPHTKSGRTAGENQPCSRMILKPIKVRLN